MTKRITAWSYSRWSDYDKCPKLAEFKHVLKMKEPENDAMRKGLKVHNDLSSFLADPAQMVPEPGAQFSELLRSLADLEPLHDQDWAFTNDWRITSWFADNAWFRSKLDACVVYDDNTADVVDFKTGKPDDKHVMQAELYAISVFVRYWDTTHVTVRFWYLDTGTESVYRYARSDLSELQAKWERRAAPMLRDDIFAPRPGQHCKWCAFAKSKEGPCKFG